MRNRRATCLSAALEHFTPLGARFVEPPESAKKDACGRFEKPSRESVDKYGADVIMMDDGASAIQRAAMTAGRPPSPATGPVRTYAACEPVLADPSAATEKAGEAA